MWNGLPTVSIGADTRRQWEEDIPEGFAIDSRGIVTRDGKPLVPTGQDITLTWDKGTEDMFVK